MWFCKLMEVLNIVVRSSLSRRKSWNRGEVNKEEVVQRRVFRGGWWLKVWAWSDENSILVGRFVVCVFEMVYDDCMKWRKMWLRFCYFDDELSEVLLFDVCYGWKLCKQMVVEWVVMVCGFSENGKELWWLDDALPAMR